MLPKIWIEADTFLEKCLHERKNVNRKFRLEMIGYIVKRYSVCLIKIKSDEGKECNAKSSSFERNGERNERDKRRATFL